jgi:hypothetical protein
MALPSWADGVAVVKGQNTFGKKIGMVLVNDKPVEIVSWESGKITFKTKETGNSKIQIFVPNYETTQNIHIPNIVSVSPKGDPIPQGNKITFKGKNLKNPNAYLTVEGLPGRPRVIRMSDSGITNSDTEISFKVPEIYMRDMTFTYYCDGGESSILVKFHR